VRESSSPPCEQAQLERRGAPAVVNPWRHGVVLSESRSFARIRRGRGRKFVHDDQDSWRSRWAQARVRVNAVARASSRTRMTAPIWTFRNPSTTAPLLRHAPPPLDDSGGTPDEVAPAVLFLSRSPQAAYLNRPRRSQSTGRILDRRLIKSNGPQGSNGCIINLISVGSLHPLSTRKAERVPGHPGNAKNRKCAKRGLALQMRSRQPSSARAADLGIEKSSDEESPS